MKKIAITFALLSMGLIQAEYKLQYNLDKDSVKFKSTAEIEWIATTPLYSEWTNTDAPYNCSKWIPATTTELAGKTITQKAAACSQKQQRTKQERQKDKNSELTKNIGEAVVESNIITVSSSRSVTATGSIQVGRGTKTCVEFLMTYGGGYWMFHKETGEASGFYYGNTFQEKSYSSSKIETLSVVVDGYIISRGALFDDKTNYDKYGICKQPV